MYTLARVQRTWTVDQVLAVAPDSSSQVAGRKLAVPGPWSGVGVAEGLLWGECRGSGKTPYQVTVDTGNRRYRCSCPSRKFPCKHGLGLLFLWAEGHIGESGDIAEFAAGFAAKPAPADDAPDEKAEPTATQVEAAARRAAQREQRVADGLAELDRWLVDQVGGGLARAARDPYGWPEHQAARMVDAQAPAVAHRLRRLPAVITSGNGWPERLLEELSLLHLLARAYAGRGDLEPDLLATVRSHIGFTVSKSDVLAGPAHRDTWAVVALRDLDTEAISARRVWLHGTTTGRWAEVLFFAASGESLDTSLLPGTELTADVHYYPGRAGLRALVDQVHGEATSLRQWRPTPETVPEVADRWAAALAADPWSRQIPAVLRGVVTVDGDEWALADGHGSVAVHGTELDLWRLLARCPSAPATLAGEWSAMGFRPGAIVTEGRVIGL